MKEVQMNYQELAFVMSIPSATAKKMYQDRLGNEKIKLSDTIPSNEFRGSFGKLLSIDKRYDGQDKFIFYLSQVSSSWRNFLNEKQSIKSKKLSGGKSIFYKVLPEEDLEFIKVNLEKKHLFIYGKKRHEGNARV